MWGAGLKINNGEDLTGLNCFTRRDLRSFVFVKAISTGKNTVKIESPDSRAITAPIRYAWAGQLVQAARGRSSAELPAFPFRTDNLKG